MTVVDDNKAKAIIGFAIFDMVCLPSKEALAMLGAARKFDTIAAAVAA